jgi:hypothetical protein
MNCSDSPWLFAVCGLCFAEETAIGHWAYQAKKEEEEQINVVLYVNEN